MMSDQHYFEDERDMDPNCWYCHGEGYIHDCQQEFACVHPEEGCEICTRRCPECNRPEPKS